MSGRILITGAAGLIGGILMEGLSKRYEVEGVDIRPLAGALRGSVDMTCRDTALTAFTGAETVVDLAALSSPETPWAKVLDTNVPATLNAFEAASQAGARRVVFASSNHVTGMYEKDRPYREILSGEYDGLNPRQVPLITTADPVRPDGPYALGKVLGEAAGRYYSDSRGLSVICLRIGTVKRSDRPGCPREFATFLSQADLLQLVEKCIAAPGSVSYGIFYGVSDNTWKIWDVTDSGRMVDYRPGDNAEAWR